MKFPDTTFGPMHHQLVKCRETSVTVLANLLIFVFQEFPLHSSNTKFYASYPFTLLMFKDLARTLKAIFKKKLISDSVVTNAFCPLKLFQTETIIPNYSLKWLQSRLPRRRQASNEKTKWVSPAWVYIYLCKTQGKPNKF